jgi:hypothetical protein
MNLGENHRARRLRTVPSIFGPPPRESTTLPLGIDLFPTFDDSNDPNLHSLVRIEVGGPDSVVSKPGLDFLTL